MLNMTYMKYIESNLLCFIPGKVLDEMIKVLRLVESEAAPPRTHQILQELRDLSSMAMEHFDEHVLPRVKEHKEQMDERRNGAFFASFSGVSPNFKQAKPLFIQHANDMQKIKKQYKTYKHHILYLSQNTRKLMQKVRKQNARFKAQSIKVREQERKIQEQAIKIQEQEAALTDIKKHLDEWDQKYKDLTTELVRARDDYLLKASTTPQVPSLSSAVSPKAFKSNIKPRMAQILPKNFVALRLDVERKRKSNLLPDIPVKLPRSRDDDDEGKIGSLLQRKEPDKVKESDGKSHFSLMIENLIKQPLTSIKSRKRKMAEEIDLK